MDVRVELVTADDAVLDTVVDWHCREWSHGTAAEREEWRVRLRIRSGATGIPFTLLARWDNEPVGSISVCTDDADAEFADRGPWLSGVYLLGAARDLGLGRHFSTSLPNAQGKPARPSCGYTPAKRPASMNAVATRWHVPRHRWPKTLFSGAG